MTTINGALIEVKFSNEKNNQVSFLLKPQKSSEGLKDDNLIFIQGKIAPVDQKPGTFLKIEGEFNEDQQFQAKSIIAMRDFKFIPYIDALFDGLTYAALTPQLKKTLEASNPDWRKALARQGARALRDMRLPSQQLTGAEKAWRSFEPFKDYYAYLRNQGLPHRQSANAVFQLGEQANKLLISKPYRLTTSKAIGFEHIDPIALKRGESPHSRARLHAGIVHEMDRIASQGNTVFSLDALSSRVAKLMDLGSDEIKTHIRQQSRGYRIINQSGETLVVPHSSWERSRRITNNIKRLKNADNADSDINYDPQKNSEHPLKKGQLQAITNALKERVSIITGGPGTGKSTIAEQIVEGVSQEHDRDRIVLCAPSGKAARRLSQTSGMEARTVHSLIGMKPGDQAQHNEANRLEASTVIVDEASMIDEAIFDSLLQAIPESARLIIIGDVDQLPSVGQGQVLHDMIESGVIATTRLTENVRVDEDNDIVPAAQAIRNRKLPPMNDDFDRNFVWLSRYNDSDIQQTIEQLCQSVPAMLGIDPNELQVLCPQVKSKVGAYAFNQALAPIMNQDSNKHIKVVHRGQSYHVGDRVMQTRKNDYEAGLNNGDTGIIKGIDYASKTIRLDMGDKNQGVGFDRLSNLTHANAVSVHKSQGSEYPAVIIPVSASNQYMLDWQLIYTAITRGKQRVFMVGDERALEKGLRQSPLKQRNTLLSQALRKNLEPVEPAPAKSWNSSSAYEPA